MNLLDETRRVLKEKGKLESDIKWIGNIKFKTDWETFEKIANIDYNCGYGAPQVASDLLIVGCDWWLEIHEYDGSEYKQTPKEPEKIIELKELTISQADELGFDVSCGWEDLLSINGLLYDK